MTSSVLSFRAQRTLIAMAVYAVCITAQAQSTSVDATVSIGAGVINGNKGDRALFGQYNGTRSGSNAVAILGIDYSLRDQDAGKWVDLTGSNLFGDTRELGFVWKSPGSWKFSANYNELVRVDPNTLNTGLLGAGSTTPQMVSINAGTGVDTELRTKRTSLGVGFTKIISPALQFQVDLKSENKQGSRAFGLGYTCSPQLGVLCNIMAPEPINANHTQLEARASYAMEKLRFNVGYYGSYFRNHNTALNTSGLGTAGNYNSLPLALAPDNQAHQLDLSGSYDFTQTTRGTFKLGWANALQNADFASAGLVGPVLAVNSLGNPTVILNSAGAKVTTTLAKLGVTSRPLPQLSLTGDLRYENKDDQTPLFNYNLVGTNHNLPNKKVQGKLQANWQFSNDYRGTLSADLESIDRGTYTASSVLVGVSALRQKTDETTIRAELRRKLADDVSGAISVSSSRRDGSNWLQANVGATGVTEVADPATSFAQASGAVFMPTLANRKRDKVKLFGDWQASEKLALQFSAEAGTDKYTSPSANGLHNTRMNQLGVDGSYALSDNWALNGYLSQNLQTLNQSRYAGSITAFDNRTLAASLGATGKASSKVNVGASLSYMDDRSVYAQAADASASAGTVSQLAVSGGLPDIRYRQTAVKMFATYALEKKASVRVDLLHQRTKLTDWTWGYNGVPFTYSDGATVTQNPNQNVSFVGVTYLYPLP